MKIDVESRPSYGMAVVTLDKGEKFIAESGSMVAMSSQLAAEPHFNGTGSGGFLDWLQAAFVGLVRKFLAGETLFVNHFTAKADGQRVMLAPAMVGDVVVESTVGEGSTFTLRIPVQVQEEESVRPAAATPEILAEGGTGRTVLVIDDDPNALDLLGRALQGADFRVVSASDGEQALELARTLQPSLKVVVLALGDAIPVEYANAPWLEAVVAEADIIEPVREYTAVIPSLSRSIMASMSSVSPNCSINQ